VQCWERVVFVGVSSAMILMVYNGFCQEFAVLRLHFGRRRRGERDLVRSSNGYINTVR
jgi:hypothetical protein